MKDHEQVLEEVKESDIELEVPASVPDAQVKKASFFAVFTDVIMFYHRLASCLVRHHKQSHRIFQVLSMTSQMLFAMAFVSFIEAFAGHALMLPSVGLTILVMRLVHALSIMMEQVRGKKRFVWYVIQAAILVLSAVVF